MDLSVAENVLLLNLVDGVFALWNLQFASIGVSTVESEPINCKKNWAFLKSQIAQPLNGGCLFVNIHNAGKPRAERVGKLWKNGLAHLGCKGSEANRWWLVDVMALDRGIFHGGKLSLNAWMGENGMICNMHGISHWGRCLSWKVWGAYQETFAHKREGPLKRAKTVNFAILGWLLWRWQIASWCLSCLVSEECF